MPLIPVNIHSKNYDDGSWKKEYSLLYYEPEPFEEGASKKAYKAVNCKLKNVKDVELVLKLGKTAPLHREDAEGDIEMQLECAQLAERYNALPVTPKKISVVQPHLVEILSDDRKGEFGILERYIVGRYEKHNTNQHPGLNLTNRNTPEAFTHFTLEATEMTKIACDLQGVGDTLTDTQIISVHTHGQQAVNVIIRFFRMHRCNSICKSLGLPNLNSQKIQESLIRTQPLKAGPLPDDWREQIKRNWTTFNTLPDDIDSGVASEDR